MFFHPARSADLSSGPPAAENLKKIQNFLESTIWKFVYTFDLNGAVFRCMKFSTCKMTYNKFSKVIVSTRRDPQLNNRFS